MSYSVIALAAIAAVIASADAHAATLARRTVPGGAEIALKGDIAPEDADSLAALLQAIAEDGQTLRALHLDSPGGSLVGGIALAKFIRSHGEISTEVDSGGACASACFLAFAAGNPKVAARGSLIGVHGVADGRGDVTDETKDATRIMAQIGNELGIPVEITNKMIETSPGSISWLTPDELRQMGAIIVSGAAREPGADGSVRADDTAQAFRRHELTTEALQAAERGEYAEAVRLWRLLGEEGQGAAQFNLGSMYYSGQGVAQDYHEAARWWRSAAERGIGAAQFNLGVAYALGRGVPRDKEKAYMWLSVAAMNYATAHEQELASRARDLVSRRMTEGEIAEAQRLTGGWARSR